MKCTWYLSVPVMPFFDEVAETIWRLVNAVMTCPSTFDFDDFLDVLSAIILLEIHRKGELSTSYQNPIISLLI